MPKLDLTIAKQIKTTHGVLKSLKTSAWSWAAPTIYVRGGTVTPFTRNGVDYFEIKFTSHGRFDIDKPIEGARWALSAGGGAGGYETSTTSTYIPGGGGAGGLTQRTNDTLTPGSYSVYVGEGSPGGVTKTNGFHSALYTPASMFVSVGGGNGASSGAAHDRGKPGGSGGGGRGTGGGFAIGGSGVAGQGFTGGTGFTHGTNANKASAGGGGAGGAGFNASLATGGAGGPGVLLDWIANPITTNGGGGGVDAAGGGGGASNGTRSTPSADATLGSGSGGAMGAQVGKGGKGFMYLVVPSAQVSVVDLGGFDISLLYGTGSSSITHHLNPKTYTTDANKKVIGITNLPDKKPVTQISSINTTLENGKVNIPPGESFKFSTPFNLFGKRLFMAIQYAPGIEGTRTIDLSGYWMGNGAGDGMRAALNIGSNRRLSLARWNGTSYTYNTTPVLPLMGTTPHILELEISNGWWRVWVNGVCIHSVLYPYSDFWIWDLYSNGNRNNAFTGLAGEVVVMNADGSSLADERAGVIRAELAKNFGVGEVTIQPFATPNRLETAFAGGVFSQIFFADPVYWWADAEATIPVTAIGTPVRCWTSTTGFKMVSPSVDRSPVATKLPNGKWGLLFDGVDDYMSSETPLSFQSVDRLSAFAGIHKLTDPAEPKLAPILTNTLPSSTPGYFGLYARRSYQPGPGTVNYGAETRGSTNYSNSGAQRSVNPFLDAPHTAALVANYFPSTSNNTQLYINGVATLITGDVPGAVTYPDQVINIGTVHDKANFLHGIVGHIGLRGGSLLSSEQINTVEAILNSHMF